MNDCRSPPPPLLPRAYRDECLSSQTGVMELAVTDSGAMGAEMKRAQESRKGW